MHKYPCAACDTGYGFCAEGLRHSLMCCSDCNHPEYKLTLDPWTADELVEMWEGREMPEHVRQGLERLRRRESQ